MVGDVGGDVEISSIALFGRDHELAEAEASFTSVAIGAPHVLLVGWAAGIGKTSLIAASEEMAADHGFRFLVGHCLDINKGRLCKRCGRRYALSLPRLPPTN